MANRYFRLYEQEGQQTLGMSMSLVGVEQEDGFEDVMSVFDVGLSPRKREEYLSQHSSREYDIVPPLLREQIGKFGSVIVDFATSRGYDHHNFIYFVDHTEPGVEKIERPRNLIEMRTFGLSDADRGTARVIDEMSRVAPHLRKVAPRGAINAAIDHLYASWRQGTAPDKKLVSHDAELGHVADEECRVDGLQGLKLDKLVEATDMPTSDLLRAGLHSYLAAIKEEQPQLVETLLERASLFEQHLGK